MKKSLKCFIWGFGGMLLFFAQTNSYGQNDTLKLTINQAVDMALQQNLMQKVSEIEVEKKQAKVQEYMAALYPNIKLSGSYTRNIKKQVIFLPEGSPLGTTLTIGSDNSYTGAASFSLPLFAMNIYESIKMGKKDAELTVEKLRENQINLAATVKNAYYNLLLLKQTYDVFNNSYLNAKANLENIKQLYANGMVSNYDLIRIQVQVDNLYPNLIQTQNAYENLMNIFKVVLNIESSAPVSLDENEMAVINLTEIATPSESWQQDNTTLRQLNLTLQFLKVQERMVKSSLYPSLVAIGNYQYLSQANDFKFSNYNWVPTSLVGLQVNVPIFSGFSVQRQLQQVRLSTKQLALQQQFTIRNLESQVQNSVNAINTAVKKVNASEGNVLLAQKGYQIARTRYNTGQATLLELNDADNALMQSRLNLIQARFEYLNARIDYEKVTGQSIGQ